VRSGRRSEEIKKKSEVRREEVRSEEWKKK
jgi:hypothetical protein